jgi:hypothetical protein
MFILLAAFFIIINHSFSYSKINPTDPEKVIGNWQGKLNVSTFQLRIVFRISFDSTGNLTGFMDSPDQSAKDIPVSNVVLWDDSVKFEVALVNGYFAGKLISDSSKISGKWFQMGAAFPLVLSKTDEVPLLIRPQEPKPPFPYSVEEVKFENRVDGITLAGTLTKPDNKKNLTCVILISGSGGQNRDEELLGHKPFLVLADHLTRNGIAVFRYDDRGIAESTGDYQSATTADLARDVMAAIEYLKSRNDINELKIGLIGHSEGGLIAPIVANQFEDLAFVVLMAGPGMMGKDLLPLQSELISKSMGLKEEEYSKDIQTAKKMYEIVLNEKDSVLAEKKLKELFYESYNASPDSVKTQLGNPEDYFQRQVKVILGSWFKHFLAYDPYPALTKIKCPVLAINGEKDVQVPPKENLSLIKRALIDGGNKNYKIVEIEGLNHLFQTAVTGAPSEYSMIEETMSPTALVTISDWIKSLK